MLRLLVTLALLSTAVLPPLSAQSDLSPEANDLLRRAFLLMERGGNAEAANVLAQGIRLFPEHTIFSYELGHLHVVRKEYDRAIALFQSVLEASDATDQYYVMLGAAYDLNGESAKAHRVYSEGLERFPDSGPLHLELGVMKMAERNPADALTTWERGLTLDPTHASNYFQAARTYLKTDLRGWGTLYGEIFLNLEPFSTRSMEMRTLLWKGLADAITFSPEMHGDDPKLVLNVSFFSDATALETVDDSTVVSGFPLLFERTMILSALGHSSSNVVEFIAGDSLQRISIGTLYKIREDFYRNWVENERIARHFDVTLFDYHGRLIDAGLFEAYHYYYFANPIVKDEVAAWIVENPTKFEELRVWIAENPYPKDRNPFSRLTLKKVELEPGDLMGPHGAEQGQ